MRRGERFGYLALLLLVVGTWAGTSFTIGTRREAQALARTTSGVDARETITDVTEGSGGRASSPGPQDRRRLVSVNHPSASASLQIVEVEEGEGGFIIKAQAHLTNSMDDRFFVWTLAVQPRAADQELRQLRYDDQIGLSRRGSSIDPTFEEGMPLPAGDYTVGVSLHEVPPAGVETLNDPDTAEAFILAADFKNISIP